MAKCLSAARRVTNCCLIVMLFWLLVVPVTSGNEITLEVWHVWTGTRHPLFREVLDRFEEAHPGVKVVDVLAAGSDYFEKLKVAWVAGVGPDVAMTHVNEMYGLVPMLQPLNPFFAADGITPGDLIYPPIAEMIQWNGNTYYLPQLISTGHHLLYYNRDMFAEAGLDPDNPPEFHGDFLTAARRLSRFDASGRIAQLGIDIVGANATRRHLNFQAFLEQRGSGLFSKDMRIFLPDIDEAVAVLQWMMDFADSVAGNPAASMQYGGTFRGRHQAMLLDMEHVYYQIMSEEPDFPVAIALLPRPEGEPIRTRANASWGYAMSSNTEHQEMAWELIKWLAGHPDGGGWFVKEQQRLSAWPEMNAGAERWMDNPYWSVLTAAVAYTDFTGAQTSPGLDYNWMVAEIGDAIARAARREQDPRSTILSLQSVVQARVDEEWKALEQ